MVGATAGSQQAEAVASRLSRGLARCTAASLVLAMLAPAVSCSSSGNQPRQASAAQSQASLSQPLDHTDFAVDQLPAQAAGAYCQLTEPHASAAARRAAADELVQMTEPEVQDALASTLSSQFGPSVWQAVLDAYRDSGVQPQGSVLLAMLGLLGQVEDQARLSLVHVLGNCHNPSLSRKLAELALDRKQDVAARQAAIMALANHRRQDVASTLVKLCKPEQPAGVQQAAFAALATLAGIDHLGQDAQAWARWDKQIRAMDAAQWQQYLVDNLAQRDQRRQAQQQQLEQRLADAQRAIYRAAPLDERQAVLAHLLKDPLESVRTVGLDLAVQRLVNAQPFDQSLREALRSSLSDASAVIRQRATLLLRDLADEQAAGLVAQRLASQQESNPAVLRASLLMMARLPDAAAVEPAMQMLTHADVQAEAAAALAAAHSADMLDDKQRSRAVQTLRSELDAMGDSPRPQMVTLLAALASDRDWQRIKAWLSSEDSSVRQAAAQAWAESQQPLSVLAQRVVDPVIGQIVVQAAAQRGQDVETFESLVAYRPAANAEIWARALLAMAGRVPAEAVLSAAAELAGLQTMDTSRLREQMLSAALSRTDDNANLTDTLLATLLLERGHLRLVAGKPADAMADLEQAAVLASRLDRTHRKALQRRRIEACLAMGEVDIALTIAREMPSVWSAQQFIDAASRYVDEEQVGRARRVLAGLRELLGSDAGELVTQRIAFLEARIAGATTPATQPASEGSQADENPVRQGGSAAVASELPSVP